MATTFIRKLAGLELEEKILNAAVLLCCVAIFIPWIEGQMLTADDVKMYNGFSFLTGLIGWMVFALHIFILLLTIAPLTSKGHLVRKENRQTVRLHAAVAGSLLIVAALSVLLKITFEFPLMEIRFGIHVTLLGSIATTFYSFLTWQQSNKSAVQELFHHQEPEPEMHSEPEEVPEPPAQIVQEYSEERETPMHVAPPPPEPEEQASGV